MDNQRVIARKKAAAAALVDAAASPSLRQLCSGTHQSGKAITNSWSSSGRHPKGTEPRHRQRRRQGP